MKITESQLRKIVENTIKESLCEYGMDNINSLWQNARKEIDNLLLNVKNISDWKFIPQNPNNPYELIVKINLPNNSL